MTTVRIKLSQTVVDQQRIEGEAFRPLADLQAMFDQYAELNAALAFTYTNFPASYLTSPTLGVTFPDGIRSTYTGVSLSNGSAVAATGHEVVVPGLLQASVTGQLNYGFVRENDGTVTLDAYGGGSTISEIRIASTLPPQDAAYQDWLGNVALGMRGNLAVSDSGVITGSVSSFTGTADKLLASASVEGDFQVTSNQPSVGIGFATSELTGTVSAYHTVYRDGSHIHITEIGSPGNANPLDDGTLITSDGNDDISIELPAQLYQDVHILAQGGDDTIAVNGGGGRVKIMAGHGNDTIIVQGSGGGHQIDGGEGRDTLKLSDARAEVQVARNLAAEQGVAGSAPAYTLTGADGTVTQLVSVERILFSDRAMAFDIEGYGGQAYRLYQAAFARTPDSGGLGYWINALDQGNTLYAVAQSFLDSPEFHASYDVNLSNRGLVTQFYENVLGREPDAEGLDFWTGKLDDNKAIRSQVLMEISESAENKAGLIGVIGNGFEYTSYEGA